VGLERRGFSKETVDSLQAAMRLLSHAKLNTSQAVEKIREEVAPCAEIDELLEFIRASQRGVVK
jgi:UDP-N-acetylglucosamine acyltransferase